MEIVSIKQYLGLGEWENLRKQMSLEIYIKVDQLSNSNPPAFDFKAVSHPDHIF
jgi:hypothetical protein